MSYCQGDGVAFYGHIDSENIEQIAKRILNAEEYRKYARIAKVIMLSGNISRNSLGHRYSHYNTMSFNLDIGYFNEQRDYDHIGDFLGMFEGLIAEDIQGISKQLEADGYKSIEYYGADDYVEECILANEYEYTEDGCRW